MGHYVVDRLQFCDLIKAPLSQQLTTTAAATTTATATITTATNKQCNKAAATMATVGGNSNRLPL